MALEEKFQLSKDLFLNLTESFEKNVNWHLGGSLQFFLLASLFLYFSSY